MFVKKAFKFRIYPNKEQTELIEKTFGCCRFVTNFMVAQQKKVDSYWSITNELVQQGVLVENNYKGSFFNKFQAIKDIVGLKKHYPWLKDVDSTALQASVEDVADAYSSYYKKKKGKPKFKSKKNPVQSYTTKSTNGSIKLFDKHIQLPKLGKVRFAKSKDIHGTIKRATIRKSPTGKYFVSVLAEVEVQDLPKTTTSVGIDVGLTHFATLSDQTVYENPKFFCSLEKKLARAQRILSRRKVDGANWNKQRIKVARIHEKIVNCRTDYLQKISTEIVKNHDLIGMEDLKVSNMLKNKDLSKGISEVSWYQFRAMIAYKCEWYGKQLALVTPSYTSQKCHSCGHTEKLNRVSQAKFVCVACGHQANADFNASKNIEALALAN